VTSLPDNLPDGSAAFGQFLDCLIGFLTTKVTFVLQLLSISVTRASSRFNWRISASLLASPDTTFASYRFQAYNEC